MLCHRSTWLLDVREATSGWNFYKIIVKTKYWWSRIRGLPINSNWYHHLSGCIFSPLAALGALSCTTGHRFYLNNLVEYIQTMKVDYEMVLQDFSSSGFTNWAFMTTHSWGENPIGKWQVDIYITSLLSLSTSKTAGYRAMWIASKGSTMHCCVHCI